jgi:hypothetical protein
VLRAVAVWQGVPVPVDAAEEAMTEAGTAVMEERLLPDLLADLECAAG